MKNDKDMEEILLRNNFKKVENTNDYVRGNWTIRIDKELIEVFNNPDISRGFYYCSPLTRADLQSIIDEVTEFDYNKF